MTARPDWASMPARDRERLALAGIADILIGGDPDPQGFPGGPRQMGYIAHLAVGRVEDPDDRLIRVMEICRDHPAPDGAQPPLDPVQAHWGAPWHMDAGKVRSEMPVHILMAGRRAECRNPPEDTGIPDP